MEEEGFLREADGGWSLGEIDRVVVPAFLRQVIDGRVERLGEDVRQPLAMAAVIGQEVPLALWAQLAGLDDEALLAIVEQAVEAHLLTAERDGVRVRFVHALTREALYEGVLPPRRRLWHQQVAEALMAGVSPDVDTVAYHLQQAGDPRAWEWLVQAADRAQRAYAWLTAAERLQAATDLLTDIPGQELTRARLLYRLGKLHRFSDPAAAIGIFAEAERLASALCDAILVAEARYTSGVALSYADQFRAGLEAMTESSDALLELPLEATRTVTPVESWLADALPEMAPIDMTGEDEAATLLHAGGFHFRHATRPWFLASSGQLGLCRHAWRAIRCGARRSAGSQRGHPLVGRVCLLWTRYRLCRAGPARRGTPGVRSLSPALCRVRPPHPCRVLPAQRAAGRSVDLRRGRSLRAAPGGGRGGGGAEPGWRSIASWRVAPTRLSELSRPRWAVGRGARNPAQLPDPGNAYLRREVTGALGIARSAPRRTGNRVGADPCPVS